MFTYKVSESKKDELRDGHDSNEKHLQLRHSKIMRRKMPLIFALETINFKNIIYFINYGVEESGFVAIFFPTSKSYINILSSPTIETCVMCSCCAERTYLQIHC